LAEEITDRLAPRSFAQRKIETNVPTNTNGNGTENWGAWRPWWMIHPPRRDRKPPTAKEMEEGEGNFILVPKTGMELGKNTPGGRRISKKEKGGVWGGKWPTQTEKEKRGFMG